MNKVIHMYYINKIKDCTYRIFELEDDDYVDYKAVNANYRAIEHWLDKAGIKDEKCREDLRKEIYWTCDTCKERLEKLGWTIECGIVKQEENNDVENLLILSSLLMADKDQIEKLKKEGSKQ